MKYWRVAVTVDALAVVYVEAERQREEVVKTMRAINERYLGELEAKIIKLRKTERSIEEHQRALEVLNKRGSSTLGVVLYAEHNNPNSKPYPFYEPQDQRLMAALVEPVKAAIAEEIETLKKEQQNIIAQYFTPGGAE